MENQERNQYDVVSITRAGSEKRANYIQDALRLTSKNKITTSGQFVKVFADIFLKHEAGKRSYA